MHERSGGRSPYDMAREPGKYPLERILSTAELAANRDPQSLPALVQGCEDEDGGVRFWAVTGLLIREKKGVAAGHGTLVSLLADPSPSVRVAAAEVLARFGEPADETLALRVLTDHADASGQGVFVAVAALNAIDHLGARAEPIRAALRKRPAVRTPHPRYDSYVGRLLKPNDPPAE